MKKHIYRYFHLLLLFALVGLGAACSSDGGSSGSAAVPANAILIDNSATAESTTITAVGTGDAIISAFGVEVTTTLTGKDIINVVLEKAHNRNLISAAVVNGVAFNEPCLVSGSISGDETGSSTSYNATATFNACDDGDGFVFNGNITISETFSSNLTGPYTEQASGNLNVTFSGGSLGFNGFNYAANGDDSTGNYTVTIFTFAINPSTGGGYAVQLTQSLVGNEFRVCELSSGQILITGASGSQARATINPNDTTKVEYHSGDGNFVETDNSPLGCLV